MKASDELIADVKRYSLDNKLTVVESSYLQQRELIFIEHRQEIYCRSLYEFIFLMIPNFQEALEQCINIAKQRIDQFAINLTRQGKENATK